MPARSDPPRCVEDSVRRRRPPRQVVPASDFACDARLLCATPFAGGTRRARRSSEGTFAGSSPSENDTGCRRHRMSYSCGDVTLDRISCRVLCVDDSPDVLQACASILTRARCAVLTASSIAAARAILERRRGPQPSVVVSDFELAEPGRGTDLLDEVAVRWPWVRRILITGCPFVLSRRGWHAATEPHVVVAKPFTPIELQNAVLPDYAGLPRR